MIAVRRGERDGGPVGVARRAEVVAVDPPGAVGAQPVDGGTPGRLDGGEPDAPRRQRLGHGGRERPGSAGRERSCRTRRASTPAPPGPHQRNRAWTSPSSSVATRLAEPPVSPKAAWGWSRRASRSTPLARAATPVTPRSIGGLPGEHARCRRSRSSTDGFALDLLDQVGRALGRRLDGRVDRRARVGRKVALHPAGNDEVAQEAVARHPLVEPLQRLLDARARRRCRSGSWRPAQMLPMSPTWLYSRSSSRAMVRIARARAWRIDAGHLLDRLAEAEAVRDRAHAADPLGDVEAVHGRQALDALLQPAMRVEEARRRGGAPTRRPC